MVRRVLTMICQCQFCGRVRIGDEWTRDATAKPDVLGHCPACGELRRRQSALKYSREGRMLLQRRKKGYGPPKPGEDVFRGFKGE